MEGDTTYDIQSSSKMSDPLLNKRENFFKRTKLSAGEVLSTSCMVFIFVAIIILVIAAPIIQVIVGSLYKNSCPANPLIPIYLIVSGVAMLTLFIILIIKIIVEKSYFWTFVQILVSIFCLACSITGTVWIFSAKRTVQYYNPYNPSTYCDSSVFSCAYGTLFISYGFLVGTVCSSSKRST